MSPNNFPYGHLMKIECFVASLAAVGSPGRAEHLVNSGHFCGRGATLRCRNPLLSPSNFTRGRLMKIEWLVTNVTVVGCPDRAERAILGVILGVCFLANSGCFCGRGATLRYRNPLLNSDDST